MRSHLSSGQKDRIDLNMADLNGANLSELNLHGADLSGTDLRNTNLNGTDLTGVDLREAKINAHTEIPYKWRLVWHLVNQNHIGHNFRKAESKYSCEKDT